MKSSGPIDCGRTIGCEDDLLTIWQELPVPGTTFHALTGERISLLSPGVRNKSDGPDFLNGILLIDGNMFVGPVEMHMRESDWFTHKHHEDPVYSNVILHVLAQAPDEARLRLDIPTIVLRRDSNEKKEETSDFSFGEKKLSLQPLVELAWSRLLCRAIEAIRREPRLTNDLQIEREFLYRLFDALGFSANRGPMKRVAERLFAGRHRLIGATFDEILSHLFSQSGLPVERLTAVASRFVSESRLRSILPSEADHPVDPEWNFRVRPANTPERRIWAGGKLVYDLYNDDLLTNAARLIASNCPYKEIRGLFLVRFGSKSLIGTSRASDIIINALLPVLLAEGVVMNDSMLIQGTCQCYRAAPSLSSNRAIRQVEKQYLDGGQFEGAFLQQGAIEYQQRYLLPDKTGISMVAEKVRN